MIAGPPIELDEILRSEVGSGLHGIAIEGTDDHDEMGIFIEPMDVVLEVASPVNHDVWRTQPEGARSGPGDIDLVRYSLRKFMRLALKGNPTILLPLFAPVDALVIRTAAGEELRGLRSSILSRSAGRRFRGYLHSQMRHLQRARTAPQRPELVARHGFDTKFASHALRLAIQGVELMREGTIHLPMREDHLKRLRAIKMGEVPYGEVVDDVHRWSDALDGLLEGQEPSPLREAPDLAAVSGYMRRTHLAAWSAA